MTMAHGKPMLGDYVPPTHPSHVMTIENGSVREGEKEWFGTFFCRNCRRREYRPRIGRRLPDPALHDPCRPSRR